MLIDKNLKRQRAFQQILNGQPSYTKMYMNISTMRTKILCHRIEKKINQKLVWLKVASVNISCSTMHGCVPLPMVASLFVIGKWC